MYNENLFKQVSSTLAGVDYFSLRLCDEKSKKLSFRNGVLDPPSCSQDRGAMVVVHDRGGMGYAATSDLSDSGIQQAASNARTWAHRCAANAVTNFSQLEMPVQSGSYKSPVVKHSSSVTDADMLSYLSPLATHLSKGSDIVDSVIELWLVEYRQQLWTNSGSVVEQDFEFIFPSASVAASKNNDVQRRGIGIDLYGAQAGWERLDHCGFKEHVESLPEEAIELVLAPNCPSENMDILIAPDQMVLQIHESIGHPLELDRIIGDERNYAGTSFVNEEMFGSYQYGSELLNVVYDPTMSGELASFNFDDEGQLAEKQHIIKNGILQRPIGGVLSHARSSLDSQGVGVSRSCSWNRPPIDRMANLNVEPGQSQLEEMMQAIDRGLYLKTNNSWSIDDSRNKFQFGCEWGQLIENGKLTNVVKNPSYRGISANFWRNLKMVGDESTFKVMGTPYCGKGEPNQVIRVGHASPACVFEHIDVFGGRS